MDTKLINEQQLVNLAKLGDTDAINILYELNYKICDTVSYKYQYDIRDNVWSLLWEAIDTFDFTKNNKFSTWFWQRCFFHANKELAKRIKEPHVNTLELNENYNDERLDKLKELISYIPKQKVKELMIARYFSGEKLLTYEELSVKFNYTTQYAHILDNYGKTYLRKKLLKKC